MIHSSIHKLKELIHDALRTQHPEWIEPDGRSPICDEYEARFAELLDSIRSKASGMSPTTSVAALPL
jgi:hypothetical protein